MTCPHNLYYEHQYELIADEVRSVNPLNVQRLRVSTNMNYNTSTLIKTIIHTKDIAAFVARNLGFGLSAFGGLGGLAAI